MSSYTNARVAKKAFKTLCSFKKNVRERHEEISEGTPTVVFHDEEIKATDLSAPEETLEKRTIEGYRMWLGGRIEGLIGPFHPDYQVSYGISMNTKILVSGKVPLGGRGELIWWPDLYAMPELVKMVIRFFLEKCDFKKQLN